MTARAGWPWAWGGEGVDLLATPPGGSNHHSAFTSSASFTAEDDPYAHCIEIMVDGCCGRGPLPRLPGAG